MQQIGEGNFCFLYTQNLFQEFVSQRNTLSYPETFPLHLRGLTINDLGVGGFKEIKKRTIIWSLTGKKLNESSQRKKNSCPKGIFHVASL